jgi:hypothetical protein
MHIYLKHERHGTKVATVEAEAVYDESNGWVRYDPNPVQASGNVVPIVKTAEPKAKRPYKRKAA